MDEVKEILSGKPIKDVLEGINDKNIFKAVIFAGGAVSGKGFISNKVMADTGAKVINPDSLFELAASNKSITGSPNTKASTEQLYRFQKDIASGKKSYDTDIWYSKDMQDYRSSRLKVLLKTSASHCINGMLPLVIDGTGKDYRKIETQYKFLDSLGYDVAMVFVNTSLEVAQERNKARARKLKPAFVEKSWKDVQSNLGKFQSLFGSQFYIVDNNEVLEPGSSAESAFFKKLGSIGRNVFSKPVKNKVGNRVIDTLKITGGKYYQDIFKELVNGIDKNLVV